MRELAPSSSPLLELRCELESKYKLDRAFAYKVALTLMQLKRETGVRWDILSGYRDAEHQQELIDAGRGAAISLSNHTLCPAHAVDVWPRTLPVRVHKLALLRVATFNGLRVGGCHPSQHGCIDPDTGIPQDWNHLDDGPRAEKGR